MPFSELLILFPGLPDFFRFLGVRELPSAPTVEACIALLQDELFEDLGMTRQCMLRSLESYLAEKTRKTGAGKH